MLKSKVPQTEQGFSFLEVIVAILILTGFLFAALQMMVVTARVTGKAKLKREASNWIETDKIDVVFTRAQSLTKTLTKCTANNYNAGYAQALRLTLVPDSYDSFTSQLSQQPAGFAQKRGGTIERTLRLTRTYDSASSSYPYKVLKISYIVNELDRNGNPIFDSDGEPLAKDYLEVIPNVALECP